MLDQERANRLEDKIDRITDSISQLQTTLVAKIATSDARIQFLEDTLAKDRETLSEIKADMERGKGVIGFLTLLTGALGAIGSFLIIFKK